MIRQNHITWMDGVDGLQTNYAKFSGITKNSGMVCWDCESQKQFSGFLVSDLTQAFQEWIECL